MFVAHTETHIAVLHILLFAANIYTGVQKLQLVCCPFLNSDMLISIGLQQDDAVSYINDALKQGTQVSSFRKEKIGKDANGTSYW